MTIKDKIITLLGNGPHTAKMVSEATGQASLGYIRLALHELFTDGRAVRVKRGLYALPGSQP